jgi:uncharacterized protein YjbJ (UPF0337 family)
MNSNQIKGKLKRLQGEIKRRWGQVTQNDVVKDEGNMERLIGRIQGCGGDGSETNEKKFKSRDSAERSEVGPSGIPKSIGG